MKAYLEPCGLHHRTQAEAKATGRPFTQVDIPTDQRGLLEYINSFSFPTPAPSLHPLTFEGAEIIGIGSVPFDPTLALEVGDVVVGKIHDEIQINRPYKNGDPTTPFMKSRDPGAVFTCTTCGANNRNP